MAVLYSYKELNDIKHNDINIPAKRYIHKFVNHRKEVKRLKFHEKDFLFRVLKMLRNEEEKHLYNLFEIPEAKEFLFDWIILIHSNQVMVFDGPVPGPFGLLSLNEKQRNKTFFYEYLSLWKTKILNGRGAYCSIIKTEVFKKIRSWQEWGEQDATRLSIIDKKIEFIYATFYHIYYRVKLFFDERPNPYIVRCIGGYDVVFNVYSFVHILSRHYYPNMNHDIGLSLNKELGCINLDYLPDEIFKLIERSNSRTALSRDTEYLLYSSDNEYYIMWLKYKRLNETKKMGLEVRSFYKCKEQRDLEKVHIKRQNVCSLL